MLPLIFIALCTVIGALAGVWLVGLLVGLVVVFIANI